MGFALTAYTVTKAIKTMPLAEWIGFVCITHAFLHLKVALSHLSPALFNLAVALLHLSVAFLMLTPALLNLAVALFVLAVALLHYNHKLTFKLIAI